ncbi:MAG TPA: hypothetical protein VLT33_50215 [Labilithrix sp.]|nr:hypothetical protein [Labilithrix sp.]
MSPSRILLALLLASCTFGVVACAAPSGDDGENADSQDQDVKKKVKPKGGNGAFDLIAPTSFNTAGFTGGFFFDGAPVKGGERREKVPGTYVLQAQAAGFGDGQTMNQQLSFAIAAGAIAKHQLGGLRIRFDQPVTLGSNRVDFVSETGNVGFLNPNAAWQTTATGASMLVLAGKVGVTSYADAVKVDSVVAENALKEIVLPTSKVALLVDAYDPDYPTPGCQATFVRAGAQGFQTTALVRKADGSPNASFVVPQGVRAPVSLNAYGIEISQNTIAGGTNTFQLNRLEIDDVEVAQAGGGTTLVKGTVSVSRKNADGTFTGLNCNFPTHSGIDLPDGAYRVVSRASSPSGVVTSTEEVTFP